MTMEDSIKSGYQLISIILKDSLFRRDDYLNPPSNIKVDIKVQANNRENFLDSVVTVIMENKENENNFEIVVTMIGIFEKIGAVPLSDDEFIGINAPAIVYPFIRQHIRSLSLDSGMRQIILPTINFEANYNNDSED